MERITEVGTYIQWVLFQVVETVFLIAVEQNNIWREGTHQGNLDGRRD